MSFFINSYFTCFPMFSDVFYTNFTKKTIKKYFQLLSELGYNDINQNTFLQYSEIRILFTVDLKQDLP